MVPAWTRPSARRISSVPRTPNARTQLVQSACFDRVLTRVPGDAKLMRGYTMSRELFDPYAVLGLPPTATSDEITRAYRTQVRALHPDTRTTSRSISPADEQLRRVLAAYEMLRDPERRRRYDRASKRIPTASQAPAEKTNTRWYSDGRIVGLNVRFGARRLS
jgi:DnaJ-like protein